MKSKKQKDGDKFYSLFNGLNSKNKDKVKRRMKALIAKKSYEDRKSVGE